MKTLNASTKLTNRHSVDIPLTKWRYDKVEECCVQQTGEAAHTDVDTLAVVLFRLAIVSKKWIIQVTSTLSQRKYFLECFTLQKSDLLNCHPVDWAVHYLFDVNIHVL